MTTISTPNTPARSINAWTYLDEDEPPNTGYTSPNSSYQSLVKNGVYRSTDMLNICFYDTVPDGNGYYTLQIGNATTVHPDGSTTLQYMQYTIRDARSANPRVQILATLNYNDDTLSRIFSGPSSQWPTAVSAFAKNLLGYLMANQMNGFDIDWEGGFSYSITAAQFAMLFQAIRQAFNAASDGKYYYLTLSPASVGYLDATTVNTCFDFVNLQLYSGFTFAQDFLKAGILPSLLAYGAKFESSYQDADGAYQGMQSGFLWSGKRYSYGIATQWRLNSNNWAYEQSQQVLLHGLSYGVASTTFDDTSIVSGAGNPPITSFTVRAGDVLDAIETTSTTSSGSVYELLQHGGNGGSAQTVTLAPGDLITQIGGYTGTWFGWSCVAQITFRTQQGNVYGPFGSMTNVRSPLPFGLVAPAGQSVVAFRGTAIQVPEAGGSTSFVIGSLGVSFGAPSASPAA